MNNEELSQTPDVVTMYTIFIMKYFKVMIGLHRNDEK